MALSYVYEQQTFASGWFDDSGRTNEAWWDQDITSLNGVMITLDVLVPGFVDDLDTIFAITEPVTIVVFPGLFVDEDFFFVPASARALGPPDKLLKNEVIRVR